MPDDGPALGVETGFGQRLAGAQHVPGLSKDPRSAQRAAPDHHARATCLAHAFGHMVWLGDVAVADDGDALHRRHHLADAVPVGLAAEHLAGEAAVHGDRGNAHIFKVARQLRGHEALGIPAQANLGRHGHAAVGVLAHGFHDAACKLHRVTHLTQQQRAAVLLGHLVHWAAHVDVDQLGAVVGGPHRGLGQRIAPVAVQLHAAGLVEVVGGRKFKRAARTTQQRLTVQQIGACQTHATKFATQNAKRQIAVAGHGGQQHGRLQGEWADAKHGRALWQGHPPTQRSA